MLSNTLPTWPVTVIQGCGHEVVRNYTVATVRKLWGVNWRIGLTVNSNSGERCPECVETDIAKSRREVERLIAKL